MGQDEVGGAQTPSVQTFPSPHEAPQPPQLAMSIAVSTHVELHRVIWCAMAVLPVGTTDGQTAPLPASLFASHVTTIVEEPWAHAPPSGTGPSVTVKVNVTGPSAVHVKLVAAEVGAENVPLGADHAYVS